MDSDRATSLRTAVIENAKWVDRVVTSFVVAGLLATWMKLIGQPNFEWQSVSFSTDGVWFVFMLFTIAHLYTSWLLVRSCRVLRLKGSDVDRLNVFRTVTATGGILVRGMFPRSIRSRTILGIDVYHMRSDDPSTWVAIALMIISLVGIIPFRLLHWPQMMTFGVVGLLAAIMNWWIASNWIVALSDLTMDPDMRISSSSSNPWTHRVTGSIFKGVVSVPFDLPAKKGRRIAILKLIDAGWDNVEAPPFQIDLYEGHSLRIGRDPDLCGAVIANPSVSRLHARILWINGVFRITDEGATVPCRINGHTLLIQGVDLGSGDRIEFGSTTYVYKTIDD